MNANNHYWAIVPAAGEGNRMQTDLPKQYLSLAGKPIIQHTLETLLQVEKLSQIVVVLGDNHDAHWQSLELAYHPKIVTTVGAAERCVSVLNGLLKLASVAAPTDWVLVHDAARPCVTLTDIENLILQLEHHPTGGLLGTPIKDTVKHCQSDGHIEKTLNRNTLWQALTPQLFRYQLLRESLEYAIAAHYPVTDEASAIEYYGQRPFIVRGCSSNIKITHAEDLQWAEFYLTDKTI